MDVFWPVWFWYRCRFRRFQFLGRSVDNWWITSSIYQLVHHILNLIPSRPLDNIWAVVVVWRIRWKIIRTLLCSIMYMSILIWTVLTGELGSAGWRLGFVNGFLNWSQYLFIHQLVFLPKRHYVTFGYLLLQICLSSVMFVLPSQGVETFRNISSPSCTWTVL